MSNFLIILNDTELAVSLTLNLRSFFKNCQITTLTSLEDYNHDVYDAYFLDIEISNHIGAGLVFSLDLKLTQKDPVIIFISKHIEYWPSAYRVNAYWFIPKNDFNKEIYEVLISLREKIAATNYIYIKQNLVYSRLYIHEILCIYKQESRICYVTNKITYKIWDTLKNVEDVFLNSNYFIKINSGVLINISYIKQFSLKDSLVILDNGMQFPISRHRKNHFIHKLPYLF